VQVTAPRLPAATETTAYLVIAEALTNAARHTRPDRVSVRVELEGDVLVVEVRADGTGRVRSLGLTGLVDRVDAAGGAVTITSTPGGSTALCAALPVDVA
jgi:signal transduction histidine kinase